MRFASLAASLVLITGLAAVALPQGPIASVRAEEVAFTSAGSVFFTKDSDELTPAAKALLDGLALQYAALGSQLQVNIAGHADKDDNTESSDYVPSYMVGLSQRRASNVRSYLSEKGVPDGVMTTQAFGDTKAGKDAGLNRRVEVSFGPGAGW